MLNWTDISKMKDTEHLCEVITSSSLMSMNGMNADEHPYALLDSACASRGYSLSAASQSRTGSGGQTLGDTALKKAVRFNQPEAISLLLEHGARLDSPNGILATAWNLARDRNPSLTEMLLDTPGAIRLILTVEEQQIVDDIIYEESSDAACEKIRMLDSEVLIHAVVNGFNWDDSPEPMIAAAEHAKCAEITKLDMAELMEADYWLEMDQEEVITRVDGPTYRHLAAFLTRKG